MEKRSGASDTTTAICNLDLNYRHERFEQILGGGTDAGELGFLHLRWDREISNPAETAGTLLLVSL